ncbi:putative membrane protein ArfC [Mycobacterium marinum]|nr:putative membrane protein ArfC [Mycobacterium marinum]
MAHVHWWLIILSFLLGLVLTCALMVRSTKY